MSKRKIELPAELGFSIRVQVRISDLNYGNHLGNDALISLLHEARVQLLANRGLSEKDCGDGVGILLTDLDICYTAESFYGDLLEIEIGVIELSRSAANLGYRVIRHPERSEVARAQTGIAFFNYPRRRLSRAPQAFRAAFETSLTD